MAEGWKGRFLTDEELVSILRNWTGGDLGSIALCVGVLASHLAADPALQAHLRSGGTDAVVDEILRIDDPFVTNRRKTTCPVHVGGVDIAEGQVVKPRSTDEPSAGWRRRDGRGVIGCGQG